MSPVSAILVVAVFAASMVGFGRKGTAGMYGIEFTREDSPAEFWSVSILLSCAAAGLVFLLTMFLRN
jgi:hypothetical protein